MNENKIPPNALAFTSVSQSQAKNNEGCSPAGDIEALMEAERQKREMDLCQEKEFRNNVLAHATSCKSPEAILHAPEVIKEDAKQKEPTPQELQRRFHADKMKEQMLNDRYNSKKGSEKFKVLDSNQGIPGKEAEILHPDTLASIEAIKAGAGYVLLLDDGKQTTMHAAKMSQPAILGLLVKFAAQLAIQDIKV